MHEGVENIGCERHNGDATFTREDSQPAVRKVLMYRAFLAREARCE